MNTNDKAIEILLNHLDSGGEISNFPQNIIKFDNGLYHLYCYEEGCCDSDFTKEELINYLKMDTFMIVDENGYLKEPTQ